MSALRKASPGPVYIALCLGLALLMAGHTVNHLWSGLDTWVWLGPVKEFAAHPLHPHHPLIATDAPDSYMGPYSFVLGLITRLTGADPITVLGVAAMINLGLFVVGLWFFIPSLSERRWAPPLALVFTLLAWGWVPWRWAGYPNLNSLGTVLPLGSTFAYGTALFFLGALWRWLVGGLWKHLAVASVCFPLTVLTHQATALWAVLIAAGFVVSRFGHFDRRKAVALGTAGVAVAGVVVAWPFYPVARLLANLGGYDTINAATYWHVIPRSFLAAPGLLLIVQRARRAWVDPFVLGLLFVSALYVFGWITDKGSLGRVFPGVMLLVHTAMADWAATRLELAENPSRDHRATKMVVATVVVVGLAGTATGWLRSVPRSFVPASIAERLRLTSYFDPNRGFSLYLDDSDVVAAVDGAAIPIGGYSAKVVAVNIPEPFVGDADQRHEDLGTILDPTTPSAERDALIAKYGIRWLVVHSADAGALLASIEGSEPSAEVNGFAIIRLP